MVFWVSIFSIVKKYKYTDTAFSRGGWRSNHRPCIVISLLTCRSYLASPSILHHSLRSAEDITARRECHLLRARRPVTSRASATSAPDPRGQRRGSAASVSLGWLLAARAGSPARAIVAARPMAAPLGRHWPDCAGADTASRRRLAVCFWNAFYFEKSQERKL